MNKQRKNRLIIICSIVIGVALTVTLLVYALRQNINLFYTATEIIQGKPDGSKPHVGQRLRIGGMVVINSVQRDPNSLNVTFAIADVGPQVMVQYEGILPDLFQEGKGVVAQGELINANTIKAVEVLAKHDENYVPSEVMEAMKGMENVSIPSNSKQ